MKKYFIQLYRHTLSVGEENLPVDIESLGIHPDLIFRLAELGLVEVKHKCIPADQVRRLKKIVRLRRDLGVNLPGAAIILDLLDRIDELETELSFFKRR